MIDQSAITVPPPSAAALSPPTHPRDAALVSLLQVHWFIRLRWAFVAVALAFLGLERFITPSAVRPNVLVIPILLLAIVNLVWMGVEDYLLRRLRQPNGHDPVVIQRTLLFANAQVGVDLFLLTLILRFTGGIENPMGLFYLFHMSIGALLLRPIHAIGQGLWAMLLYVGLATGEYVGWVAPHYDFLPQFPSPGSYARGEFVTAMVVVMACGVFAMLYFTLHITGRLVRRELELSRAQAALTRSEAAIYDLQQRRSRFLQTAAHQLKGPLAAIETLIGLLRDGIVPPDGVKGTYEKLLQRCRDGTQQVTELLTLARVQRADPGRHGRSAINVAQTIREVCQRYMPLADRKGIDLMYRVRGEDGPTAMVDPQDLIDCLSNLIDNAIKYTNGPGSVSVSIVDTRYQPAESRPWPKDHVAITVTDTGMGLDAASVAEIARPEARGSIFDAFRRGNNALSAAIAGTGLGLAIVREVVEQTGGRILVRSRLGEGSSFTITFPTRLAAEGPGVRDTRASIVMLDSRGAESSDAERGTHATSPEPTAQIGAT
ncbi:MAG: HAMP domain-containing sensor histidine kinase [Phycisphaerae bacterium]